MCKAIEHGAGAGGSAQAAGSASGRPARAVRFGPRAFLLLCFAVVGNAQAADQRFALLLDTDNDSTTGCVVSTASGPVSGSIRY